MEFFAKVNSFKGYNGSPDIHYPQVVMSDGAIQWVGEYQFCKDEAQKIAEKKARSYNEV